MIDSSHLTPPCPIEKKSIVLSDWSRNFIYSRLFLVPADLLVVTVITWQYGRDRPIQGVNPNPPHLLVSLIPLEYDVKKRNIKLSKRLEFKKK